MFLFKNVSSVLDWWLVFKSHSITLYAVSNHPVQLFTIMISTSLNKVLFLWDINVFVLKCMTSIYLPEKVHAKDKKLVSWAVFPSTSSFFFIAFFFLLKLLLFTCHTIFHTIACLLAAMYSVPSSKRIYDLLTPFPSSKPIDPTMLLGGLQANLISYLSC